MKIIELNLHKIIDICKRFHVRKLWVFGSILTSRFNEDSDVDFCVDFEWDKIPMLDSANNFFGFQEALELLLERKIDLTDDSAVRNPYFREELNETRQLIYG
ncbi:MAG: nucleotidyltransferase domain-containing protein [Muribaculaceae bacterium]|nr:nucleotidyltransferase domain-containing protein [Muribaculaceae bacterium]MBO5187544.1 nucleotidyltransferase domain-containing protein [Prevotella sp.]